MKKLLSIFALIVLLVSIMPVVAMAQPEGLPEGCTMEHDTGVTDCPATGFCGAPVTTGGTTVQCGPQGRWGVCCMLNTLYTVTNWVFYIMTIVAVLMIVFGGFTYITAAGDPAKAGKGKLILTYAIIGLAIALVAKLIPSLVRFIIGV